MAALAELKGLIDDAIDRAVNKTLARGISMAHELSHGPFKTADLRKMYNPRGPYSTADPHPPADPAIINLQTGGFDRSWQARKTPSGGQIVNDSPVADYLQFGTQKMIQRPIAIQLSERIADIGAANLEQEVRALEG